MNEPNFLVDVHARKSAISLKNIHGVNKWLIFVAIIQEIYLDWWPMTRDCSVYALSILALIICLADEVVYWYEAAVLVAMYVAYIICEFMQILTQFEHNDARDFIVMYYNVRISQWARSICTCWAPPPEATPLLSASHQEKLAASSGESKLKMIRSYSCFFCVEKMSR
jgi:Ca2+/Na+ antiporter